MLMEDRVAIKVILKCIIVTTFNGSDSPSYDLSKVCILQLWGLASIPINLNLTALK